MNLETISRVLLEQYNNRPELWVTRELLKVLDEQVSDPLEAFTFYIDKAENVVLDALGSLLGVSRPFIRDDSVETFGWSDDSTTFGQAPFADTSEASPTRPMSDISYRRLLKARGIAVIGRGTLPDIQRSATNLFTRTYVHENVDRDDFDMISDSAAPRAMTSAYGKVWILGATGSDGWVVVYLDPLTHELSDRVNVIVLPTTTDVVGLSYLDDLDRFYITMAGGGLRQITDFTSASPQLGPLIDFTFPGVVLPGGAGTGIGSWNNRRYIAAENFIFELDLSAGTITQVATTGSVGHVWSIADTPRGMLFGATPGFYILTDLPDDSSQPATFEHVLIAPGQKESAAYYGGRLFWNLRNQRQILSKSLDGETGFTVYGEHYDPLYLNAVEQRKDLLFCRPGGMPMTLLTQEVPHG